MTTKKGIYEIESNENIPYIDEILEEMSYKIPDILDFFNIKKIDKINIKFWDDLDKYKEHLEQYTEYRDGMCADTFDGKINTLTLQAANQTETHRNQTIKELKGNVVHEFVHICQTAVEEEKPEKENSNSWYYEALATNLGNKKQFGKLKAFYVSPEELEDFNNLGADRYEIAYTIGNYLITNYSREELLELAKHPSLLSKLTKEIINKAKDWVNYQIIKESSSK